MQVPDLNARNNSSFLKDFVGCIYVYRRRAGISFATYANRTMSRHARQGEPQYAPRFDRRGSHANRRARNLSDNRSSYIFYWQQALADLRPIAW